ncbi:MAG TPA: 2-dehydropantoate 2-reductase [Nitrospinae bacterium]|nr:2-dehydropantoate 2-reductase [Nitrospinota bacterium]
MSKVAILGAGAIGCIYGARLSNLERHDVTFCVRQTFEKLHIETPSGIIEAPARCITDPVEAGPAEWIILAVKCHQIKDVDNWLRALAGPGSIIAVLQNGVEHIENTTPHAYGARVLPVVVQCPADRLAPGRVRQNAMSNLLAPATEDGHALETLFEGSDIGVKTTPDFVTAKWLKLCGNISRNPATALTGRGRGVVRAPGVAEFCRALVEECAAVGRAEGANLPENIAEEITQSQFTAGFDQTTSMLVDVRAGIPLEADGMTGAVVRIGERHGIETPVNKYVTALLSAINTQDVD